MQHRVSVDELKSRNLCQIRFKFVPWNAESTGKKVVRVPILVHQGGYTAGIVLHDMTPFKVLFMIDLGRAADPRGWRTVEPGPSIFNE